MKKPNFIFIFMDDMGWKDLSYTGSNFYETPNIDKLCAEGMRFDNAYASCPVCSPSRASFLTGKYPARLGVTDWIDMDGTNHPKYGKLIDAPYLKHLPTEEFTIANALHDAGYATWHVGKWHLGGKDYSPTFFGFEKNIGGCSWGHPHDGYFSPYGIETLSDGPDGEYLTDRITNEAIHLIEQSDGQPFFMNLCHYAVHTPIQVKAEDEIRFIEKANAMGLNNIDALIEGEFHPTLDKKDKRLLRRVVQSDTAYAAMLWNLDQNIGRLIDALEKEGKRENTILIFTSDNGGLSTSEGSPTCNLPAIEGKGWLYDGGLRVPLFVSCPSRIKARTHSDVPLTTTDFFPTILELAGLHPMPEQHCDGISFAPLLQGAPIAERPIFWHYPHYGNQGGVPGSAILYEGYKMIQSFEDDSFKLYYLKDDIGEQQELSAIQPAKAEQMKNLLLEWQQSINATFPQENPNWENN